MITDIKFRKVFTHGKLRAIVSVVVDDFIAIHEIKIIEGSQRVFIKMPQSGQKGDERDVVHPLTSEGRKILEDAIIEKYNEIKNEK